MRFDKNTVSFLLASFVFLTLLSMQAILSGDNTGHAMASVSRDGIDAGFTASRRGPSLSPVVQRPDLITDMTGSDIRRVFQEPELVRHDGPTTVWQYRSGSCVLDVFFTPGERGEALYETAVHYEIRDRSTAGDDEAVVRTCLRSIVESRNVMRMVDVGSIYKAVR